MCSTFGILLGSKRFEQTERGVEIGALASLTAIEQSELLRRRYPVLTEAAATVASPMLRNMGTIGGNICLDTRCLWYNQSLTWRKGCGFCIKKDGDLCHVAPGGTKCWAVFSGDTPPALLCLEAEVEIASASGTDAFPWPSSTPAWATPTASCSRTNCLTRVFLPESSADYRGVYRKLRVRGSIDYPLAGVAVVMKRSNGHIADARVAITAVNPAPLLVNGAGELLAGKADGRSAGCSRRRLGRKDCPATHHICAHAGVSAGDDTSIYEEGSAGGFRELSDGSSPAVARAGRPHDSRRDGGATER